MKGRNSTLHPILRLAPVGMAAAALLLCVLLTACGASRATETGAAGTEVAATRTGEALRVTRGRLAPRLLLTGELEAAEAVNFATPNADLWPAQIQWLAEDGALVEAGDVVAEFDVTPLLSNIDEMRAAVIEAENRLISERARVSGEVGTVRFEVERQRAERDKARLEATIPAEFFSAKEYAERQLALDRAELQLVDAERKWETAREVGTADVEVQRIALIKAREAVEKAQRNAERMVLKAPRAGIFLVGQDIHSDRRLRPGDSAYPGQTVGRLPDLTTLRAMARLFDVDDGKVEAGQRVMARLDAFPDRPLGGRVVEIEDIAEQPHSNSLRRFFDVAIELDQVDPEWMRPGMSVEIEVGAAGVVLDDAYLVPRAALDWSAGNPRVRPAGGSWIEVELGRCDAFRCALSGSSSNIGLAAGDRLEPAAAVDLPETAS